MESIPSATPYISISESRAEQEPTSKLLLWNEVGGLEETPGSPETASYWGFLPTPREEREGNVYFLEDTDTRAYSRKKLDPRRTAQWLRGVLGLRGCESPKLTGLPEKPQPQLEARRDHRGDRPSAVRRGLTTSSSDSAAYAGAINAAVDNLERILSEALQIADDATSLDSGGYANDDSLRAPPRDISDVSNKPLYPARIHESIRSGSNDKMARHPTTFLGAAEGPAHGCESLPLRAVIWRGLAEPDMHSGNIRGPSLPPRVSSLRRTLKASPKSDAGDEEPYDSSAYVSPDADFGPEGRTSTCSSHHTILAGRPREICAWSLDGGPSDEVIDFNTQYTSGGKGDTASGFRATPRSYAQRISTRSTGASREQEPPKGSHDLRDISLRNRSHISLAEGTKFSLSRSVSRQPIARDWPTARKRFAATVACISTALIGILVGIYAGLVPSIQYYIVDFHHHVILGNVALFAGMALPTFFCWPLPLLHGRKPYIICSLTVSLPLLFPQAIAVSTLRSPYTSAWRWALLLPRGLMGFALGFASMNFHSILTDLFGASLMSGNPHQEVVDQYDVRRNGGGLGPGFTIMAVYSAWVYAQVVLIIILLGSLTSRFYRYRSPYVGAAVASVAIGALAAVPFQMANIFSRARYKPQRTNSMTFDRAVTWTSHFVRRVIFVLVLPIAGILYTITSVGPRLHVVFPCLFAAIIGFLSCLAISECNGLLMETWDTSDLQPGMTGRPRMDSETKKKTNYSSFPRVTAGFAVIHTLAFVFAAGATALGGMVQRRLGQMLATGAVAAILLGLSVLLLAAMIRFRKVEIIPKSKTGEMNRWNEERRDSATRRASMIAEFKASGRKDLSSIPDDDVGWRPLVLVALAREELGKRGTELMSDVQRGKERVNQVVRKVSKRSLRGKRGYDSDLSTPGFELQNLSSPGPSGGGVAHRHAPFPGENLADECVVGQAVSEEDEDVVSVDDESPLGTELVVDFEDVELEDRTTLPRPKLQKKQD
ncbi:hypothetical protein DL767_007158 [Monosporascus sp. MG133]|nr:hypothetical protein DL767_007158 [Monosporascus sp. MG133]